MPLRLRAFLATALFPLRWIQGALAVQWAILRGIFNGTHQGSGLWKATATMGVMTAMGAGLTRMALQMTPEPARTPGHPNLQEKASKMGELLLPMMMWMGASVCLLVVVTIVVKAIAQHKSAFREVVGPHATELQILRDRARLEKMLRKASGPARQRRL